MIEPYESDKCCTKCSLWKPAKNFPLRGGRKSGRRNQCNACESIAAAIRYASRPRKQKVREPWKRDDAALPATTLQEQLDCVRFNKWRYPVHESSFIGWRI